MPISPSPPITTTPSPRCPLDRCASMLMGRFGVSVMAFSTTALVRGNPAEVSPGTEATPDRLAAVTHQLGLDQPVWTRSWLWLKAALHGDLGISTLSQQP